MNTQLSISIVIPAMNEERYLGACLESILKNRTESLKEIIVVDNGSTDQTIKVAESFPLVRVLRFDRPLGLPLARDEGFKVTKGDLIASIDADIQISPSWFKNIDRLFSEDDALICVSGPYHFRGFSFFMYYFQRVLSYIITHSFLAVFGFQMIGGNFVLRKKAYEQIGAFGILGQFYAEDSFIAQKIRAVGKGRFLESLFVYASIRRYESEGFFRLGFRYVITHIFREFFHRTINYQYTCIR